MRLGWLASAQTVDGVAPRARRTACALLLVLAVGQHRGHRPQRYVLSQLYPRLAARVLVQHRERLRLLKPVQPYQGHRERLLGPPVEPLERIVVLPDVLVRDAFEGFLVPDLEPLGHPAPEAKGRKPGDVVLADALLQVGSIGLLHEIRFLVFVGWVQQEFGMDDSKLPIVPVYPSLAQNRGLPALGHDPHGDGPLLERQVGLGGKQH